MATGRTTVVIEHPNEHLTLPGGTEAGRLSNAVCVFLEKFAGGGCTTTTGVTVGQGGAQASGTVTLSGATGVAAEGTITFSSSSGTTSQTINGVSTGFEQTSGTDAARGTALAAAINDSEDEDIAGVVTASDNGAGVVTITAVVKGTAGNAITLSATGTGCTASNATLEDGTDNTVTVTLNGVAVATNTTTLASDTAAAAAVAASINASEDALVAGVVTASSALGVVTVTADDFGTSGNGITLAASGTGATASGARLTGGEGNDSTVTLTR